MNERVIDGVTYKIVKADAKGLYVVKLAERV